MRRLAKIFGLAGLMLLAAAALAAHDFWLVPDAFRVAPGAAVVVRGQTSSTFPTSEAAVDVARIEEARLLSAGGATPITDLSHAGTSLVLTHRPASAGQYVVAARIRWRHVPESAEGFRRYLTLEGAPEALERYERLGLLPSDSIVRRYAKYAKTIVQAGDRGPRAFARSADHPLEFVPLSDPAATRAGDTLVVRLSFLGRPLAGARVHAGTPPRGDATAVHDWSFETDAAGRIAVPLDAAGLWNVRTLHIVPSPPDADADWDVHWATFVFQVGQRR